ncbi:unnamed protein product [Schistocephalus solidus]|uniref:Uncharacterized protein n=1 Tax=Schistocephalus solidus TaxID=70667 RepID=A0A183TMU5_SCHSO|nr:unnamed protein product [Schistocephalus solidus]
MDTFRIIRGHDSSLRSEDFFDFACTTHLRGHPYNVNSERTRLNLRSEDFFDFACTTHLRGHPYKVKSQALTV